MSIKDGQKAAEPQFITLKGKGCFFKGLQDGKKQAFATRQKKIKKFNIFLENILIFSQYLI